VLVFVIFMFLPSILITITVQVMTCASGTRSWKAKNTDK
jgi:hypothetical protein